MLNTIESTVIEEFEGTGAVFPPLGLLYIATYLKSKNFKNVKILDANLNRLSYKEIGKEIESYKPDLVGIQTMTHFLRDVYVVAELCKKISPDIHVVAGGPHVGIYPISIVKNEYIDYGISGDGEIAFYRLVDSLKKKMSDIKISQIEGVVSKWHVKKGYKNNQIKKAVIKNLDDIPSPDRTLVPYEKYRSIFFPKGYMATMITSRGCPFQCIFCNRFGRKLRMHSPEYVLAEIESLIKLNINQVFIFDDTFTVNRSRVQKICQEIINKGINIKWDARCRVDTVTYDMLKLMKQAGVSRISFGIESGSEKVLKNLRKQISLEKTIEVFKWCKTENITTFADFIIGSPGETLDEYKKTLKFIKKVKPDYLQFSIMCPYPGTDLYNNALERGLIKNDIWFQYAENPFINIDSPVWSEYFNREELEQLVKKSYKSFYFSFYFIMREIKKLRSLKEILKKSAIFLKLLKFK